MTTPIKYFLDYDSHGGWYVVPVERLREWYEWKDALAEDLNRQTAPDFARWIDEDGYEVLQFENPQVTP